MTSWLREIVTWLRAIHRELVAIRRLAESQYELAVRVNSGKGQG